MSEKTIQYKVLQELDPERGMVAGKRFKKNVPLITEFYAINPETGKQDRVRLVKGHPSIWMSEQGDLKDVKWVKDRVGLKGDMGGNLLVRESDKRMVEFMEISPQNRDTPDRPGIPKLFYRFDVVANEKEKAVKINLEATATQYAWSLGMDRVQILCDYFGIGGLTEEGKRMGLYEFAKGSPQKFLDATNSEKTPIVAYIRKAINKSYISVSAAKDSLRWADGRTIVNLPLGSGESDKAAEFFAGQILTSDEARGHYNQILGRLQQDEPWIGQQPKESASKKEVSEFNTIQVDDTETLIKRAIELGIMRRGGKMGREIFFEGKSIAPGLEKAVTYLDAEPDLRKKVLLLVTAESN